MASDKDKVVVMEGVGKDSKHSFTETEKQAYVNFINRTLQDDVDLKGVLPISATDSSLFDVIAAGVLLWYEEHDVEGKQNAEEITNLALLFLSVSHN
jgi:hypothetical protein